MNEKYDVAVIGSGSGGSEAALLVAEKGSKAILIEKDAFGGTRFHRGCYAVRALHASSRVFRQIIQSRQFGIEADLLRSSLVDWMKAQRAASTRLARWRRDFSGPCFGSNWAAPKCGIDRAGGLGYRRESIRRGRCAIEN